MTLTHAAADLKVRAGLFTGVERQDQLGVPPDGCRSYPELSRTRKDPTDWFGHDEVIVIVNHPQFTANEDSWREANQQRASPRTEAIRHFITDRYIVRGGFRLEGVHASVPIGHAIEARFHVHMDHETRVAQN